MALLRLQVGELIVRVIHVNNIWDLVVEGLDPVGAGNRINQFEDKESANKQGENFARNLSIALKEGYALSDRYFTHPDGRRVHISNALDIDRTPNSFQTLLKQGEEIKPFL